MRAKIQNGSGYLPPEVEDAVVSLLWRNPQLYKDFIEHYDPKDFLQPYCKILISAIAMCEAKMGTYGWAGVVQCIRDMGQMEEVGGLEGLDNAYTRADRETADSFGYYVKIVKEFAVNRNEYIPAQPTNIFMRVPDEDEIIKIITDLQAKRALARGVEIG